MTMTTMEEKKEDAYEEEESFLLFIAREVEESEETAHTNTLVTARTSANTTRRKKIQKTKNWTSDMLHIHNNNTPRPARWEAVKKKSRVEKRKRENEDKNV